MSFIFSKELLDILNPTNLSVALLYIVPGLCFLSIFDFVCSKRQRIEYVLIASAVISFILVKILTMIISWIPCVFSEFQFSLLCVIIAFALGFAIGKIYCSNFFVRIMLKTTYKTPHQSIWRDVLDFENGTPCYIHMKAANRVYAGTLSVMEENGDDSYLCLAGYILTTGNSGEATHEEVNYENDIRRLIVLRLRDIDRIEINYKDGSSKIKKIEKPKKPKK